MTSITPPGPARVLVAGAGDLGLSLAARMIEEGADVTTLNRSGRSVSGATVRLGDLGEPASLDGLDGADIVVFTTAPPGRDDAAYRIAYVDGPARVLAALPYAPRRVVLTSTTGVHGANDGSWVDATLPLDPQRGTARAVAEGERRLHDLAPTVIVRPAGIYGPGRTRLSDRVRAGEEAVARDATPRWTNRIHRNDVVSALFVAATHADPPPALIAVDDEPAPRDDVIRFLATLLDAPEPPSMDVAAPTGKRCRNDALRGLGWTPEFPTYREGYSALLG